MHIPDGYLSPVTCATLYADDVPLCAVAARRIHNVVKTRDVPLLATGAVFCFLVMMLNVPIPGGTTAHAVGAVLVAVLLGPWAAIVAVSAALTAQALVFGDGGVLALGANVFNMAIVMPLVGYGVYRLAAGASSLPSPRRALAAGLGGYAGLNAAALCAAVEFGLQPVLFHAADGTPLYAPYHLSQSIPAMMLAHLTVAGGVELAVTFGVVAYLQRANLPLLRMNHAGVPEAGDATPVRKRSAVRWAAVALLVTATLTPLGLLATGGAWGEDKPASLDLRKYHLKAIPAGLSHYAGTWRHAVLDGYGFAGGNHPVVGYLVSAVFGALVIGAVVLVLFWRRRPDPDPAGPPGETLGVVPSVSGQKAPNLTAGTVPAWLLSEGGDLPPAAGARSRRKASFADKTIGAGAAVVRQALFAEDSASADGFLQKVDPRVKLVSAVILLVAAGLIRHIPVLVAVYLGTLGLAAASRVPLAFFVKRVWLFIPIFTGIVVLPATLSIVTPGHVVAPLGHWWFGHEIGFTRQGLEAAGLVVTRVAVSISLVILLTVTTPWNKLLSALRALLVPRIFVVVLGMCHRYVFHLLGAVTDMYTARKARSAGPNAGVRAGRSLVASSAGALFGKTSALSEEVHMAMLSRGYTGNVAALGQNRLRVVDLAWAAACLALAVVAVGGDRVLGR